MPFTLPSIPSFRLSWRFSDAPTPPSPYSDSNGPHSRRTSMGSVVSSRASTPASPKSPNTPMPILMPSIAELTHPPAASTANRVVFQNTRSQVSELPRMERAPSYSIMAQDSQPAPAQGVTLQQEELQQRNQTGEPKQSIFTVASLKAFAKSCLVKPELKTKVAILLVWSVVFIVVLSIYLGLFMNNQLTEPPLQIALILVTLLAAFFFFHSLVRVCLAVVRPFSYSDEEQPQNTYANLMFQGMRSGPGPMGYAQPQMPIRVFAMPGQAGVAVDDDGAPKDLPPPPPAYGFWRQTVRVNPDGFYWMRRSEAENVYTPPQTNEGIRSARSSITSTGTRPPSYISRTGRHTPHYESLRSPTLRSPLAATTIEEEPLSRITPSEPSPLTARLPLR
ncbi:hypothetical protein H072_2832 [Dactylellina haptotyla CBS 200.50]|uniref:Uncharacterized protein n=1 Tax=Dactylellina haptotyla (strain CBS 200.50) TaxID=1284197 RepID=S8AJP5_DACHA|nr:hypothetical protein H072_2832 [Dactylellina haptotyla CBS 200.50]